MPVSPVTPPTRHGTVPLARRTNVAPPPVPDPAAHIGVLMAVKSSGSTVRTPR